jgi:myo-inositol-1(or 4)-monophosphatase
MSEMEKFIEVGARVAHEAGQFLLSQLHRPPLISHKGEIDLVTDVDIAAENLIIGRLSAEFPGHAFLAEETHACGQGGAHTWVVDPLDGTTNYAHRLPVFSVSLGLEIEGVVEWGVVYNPCLEEMFSARRGGGAILNGKGIHVSSTGDLGSSFLATGFPYDIRTSRNNNLDHFSRFALRALAIRRLGSAALDLCYLGAGRYDGFWEMKLHPWDCAAGYLVVREAGGTITDFSGKPGSVYDRECIASNSHIHAQMLAVIQAGEAQAGGRMPSEMP